MDFTTSVSSDITGMELVTSNVSNDEMEWSLKVALGDKRLNFDYTPSSEDYQLTVTNQNGTVLKLSEQCFEEEDCENIGFIAVDDKEMGTISYDSDNNISVVTYNDGYSETLAL